MNGEVESTATEWDVYGTVNTETNEITITAPGGTIETQWDREFYVANPQDMGSAQIDVKFHADNTFEYFAIISLDGNKYAQATVKGVYTIADGIYFLDARNAHIVNGDSVVDEALEADALMFDLYGYLVLEEGAFMCTGGGASESNGQNSNNP